MFAYGRELKSVEKIGGGSEEEAVLFDIECRELNDFVLRLKLYNGR